MRGAVAILTPRPTSSGGGGDLNARPSQVRNQVDELRRIERLRGVQQEPGRERLLAISGGCTRSGPPRECPLRGRAAGRGAYETRS